MSTSITPETGKVPLQGASAITSETVPLLSRDEVDACFGGLMPSGSGKSQYDIACQIEQAVRAKLGAGVPMTKRVHKSNGGGAVHPALLSTDEWFEFWNTNDNVDGESIFPEFLYLAQDIEQAVLTKVGIVGKEGA